MNLEKSVLVSGDKAKQAAVALIDTGASYSFISRALAESVATIVPLSDPMKFTLGNGATINITHGASITMTIDGVTVTDTFMVADQMPDQAILGLATMNKYRLKIDPAREEIYAALSAEKEEEVEGMEKLKALCAKHGITVSEGMTEEQMIAALDAKLLTPPPVVKPASAAVLKELNLVETATEAEITGKIVALKNPTNMIAAVRKELELPETASEAEITGKIMALQHPANMVPIELYNAVLQESKEGQVTRAIESALRDGMLLPTEEKWATEMANESIDKFNHFLVARGVKVTPVGVKLPQAEPVKTVMPIDDVQAAVNRQLGISDELFKKYAE